MIYDLSFFMSNESQCDRGFMQFMATVTGCVVCGMANEVFYP